MDVAEGWDHFEIILFRMSLYIRQFLNSKHKNIGLGLLKHHAFTRRGYVADDRHALI